LSKQASMAMSHHLCDASCRLMAQREAPLAQSIFLTVVALFTFPFCPGARGRSVLSLSPSSTSLLEDRAEGERGRGEERSEAAEVKPVDLQYWR